MNTHDIDIELPPLPPLHIVPSVEPVDYPEVAQALMDYARAAIEADRKRRGEPVAKVRERGFVVVDGRYVPTVLVEFPIDDWESRDRFADMVCAPQPANPRPTDDELLDQALRERDAASEMADKLADAIAKHLGIDIGEHTSSNHPWYRALDAIEIAQHAEPVAWISRETLLGMHKVPQMNIVLNRVYLRCSQVYEDEVPLFLGPQPADHFADVRKMLPSDAEIREVFLENGFTIKSGNDLKPYVYKAARALLARYGARS